MLAKGFLLGLQFKTLFENDLFYSLAKQANECAQRMVKVIKDAGFEFYADSPTNQLLSLIHIYAAGYRQTEDAHAVCQFADDCRIVDFTESIAAHLIAGKIHHIADA